MSRWVWALFFWGALFTFSLEGAGREQEIRAIDRALAELHNQWLLHRGQAVWLSDRGIRLQHKPGFYLESRRAYKEAELQWEVVEMIEERMRTLEARREELK